MKYKLIIFILLICPSYLLLAQTASVIEGVNQSLESYNESFPSEKIYVHTDRKYYSPGEMVWFQAYLVDGKTHQPSEMSGTIIVDLYDSQHKLLAQRKVYSNGGFGNGDINLPSDLKAGSYILKAYTNWMKNFDEAFMFEKELVVVAPSLSSVKDNGEVDVQFFPEGGYLVDGVKSRIAFKAINKTGKPKAVSGKIIDADGNPVADFYTEHDGMGVFSLVPEMGKVYAAKIEGLSETFPLQPVREKGFAMEVDNSKPNLLKLVFRSNQKAARDENYALMVHSRGQVVYGLELQLNKDENVISLPKLHFPSGISHITLFDGHSKPVMERLIFIEQPKGKIALSMDQESYAPRSKVSAQIKIEDAGGELLDGVFSVSVVDLGQTLDRAPQQTIYSDLLLTSDLKGYVANPMYYFDPSNEKAMAHLDLVMMTHGWSRFSWDEVFQKVSPKREFQVEKGLTVTGRLMRFNGKKPEDGGTVTVLGKVGDSEAFPEASVDEEGFFSFDSLRYYKGEKVVFKGADEKGSSSVKVLIDSVENTVSLKGGFRANLGSDEEIQPEAIKAYVEKSEFRKQYRVNYGFDSLMFRDLGSVTVEGKKRGEMVSQLASSAAYGMSNYVINFNDINIKTYINPFDALENRIPGFRTTIGGNNGSEDNMGGIDGAGRMTNYVSIRNPGGTAREGMGGTGNDNMPRLLLDGGLVLYDQIVSMSPKMIDRVEAYYQETILAGQEMGWVLAFYSKKPEVGIGMNSVTLMNGYDMPREFYSPKYDVEKPEHAQPDARVLLLWKPMMVVENGVLSFDYWNSDAETEVMIDLQGLSMAGEPFHLLKNYKISKQ